MEPEVRERFERIEATLALTAEHHRRAMEAIDKRMAAFDKGLTGLRKLVVAGMRIVTHTAKENREARAETRALKAEVRAFIKAQSNGRGRTDGNGRH